jgi:hypothetical protein
MSEAAWAFEQVPLNLTATKPVPVAGVLEVFGDLEEIQVLGQSSDSTRKKNPRVRAFRVRRDLPPAGLQKGDCLLAQPNRLVPNELAVVSIGDALTVRRVSGREGERLVFDPPIGANHSHAELRVIGGFAGILRKRVAPCHHTPASSQREPVVPTESAVSGKVRWLRGKLGMVEATCAGTTNPRLRRALRHEAKILRRQLQNEAVRY